MNRAADLIDERKFDIAVAITYEVGKNRLEALAECWEAIDAIKFYSKIMEKNNGYVENMDPRRPRRKLHGGLETFWRLACDFAFQLPLHVSQRDGPWRPSYREHSHPEANQRGSAYGPDALQGVQGRWSPCGSNQLRHRSRSQFRGGVCFKQRRGRNRLHRLQRRWDEAVP